MTTRRRVVARAHTNDPALQPSQRLSDHLPRFLRIDEAARLILRVSPKRLSNLLAAGVLREGQHYIRRRGLGTRIITHALIAWLEEPEMPEVAIPMARDRRRRVTPGEP